MQCMGISLKCFKMQNLTMSIYMHSIIDLTQPTVTNAMNADLCAPYKALEIWSALFQMYPTKYLGLDQMPPLFFQKYWDIIGNHVIFAVQSFLHTGQFLPKVNFTHVCQIPKVKNLVNMSELRSISLCNVLYKICAKVVANRLKKILSKIIPPFQSSFILGRLITENILIANEVSHFIHNLRSGSKGDINLKIDMSKAYDLMEQSFLEAVLVRFVFVDSWICVIIQCVTTVRYSFLINGQPRGYLTPTHGLRQGDPLSIYLFLLCAEGFLAMLENKVMRGALTGISICLGAPGCAIHHLLFAYDSLLLARLRLRIVLTSNLFCKIMRRLHDKRKMLRRAILFLVKMCRHCYNMFLLIRWVWKLCLNMRNTLACRLTLVGRKLQLLPISRRA